jgi:hypothetical protein
LPLILFIWESKECADPGEISNEIDLLEALTEILNGISDGELQTSFEVASNVLKRMIDG